MANAKNISNTASQGDFSYGTALALRNTLPFNKPTAIAWAVMLAFLSGAGAVNAQTTDLADVPLSVLNSVQNNTYVTLDRSGSMTWIMTNDTYYYPGDYNNEIRYRPWLVDGTLPPPKGPVRFEDADPNNFCNGLDDWYRIDLPGAGSENALVWIGGYQTGSPDKITAECTKRGSEFRYTTTEYSTSGIQPWPVPAPPAGTPPPGRTDCPASGCTAANERQNVANYWQYHRNRNLATRAAVGEVFGRQSYKTRTGFAYYSSYMAQPVYTYDIVVLDGASDCSGNPVSRLDQSCRYKFFKDYIYNDIDIIGGTPTRPALIEVAKMFQKDVSYLESKSGKTYSCRSNYNILITDGYWNTGCHDMFSVIGDADGDGRGNGTMSGGCDYSGPTLADIGYYYWNTDLMPGLKDNVPTSNRDKNSRQHLVNYTVAMGMKSSLSDEEIRILFDWLERRNITPPPKDLIKDSDAQAIIGKLADPFTNSGQGRVDDLVHTAMNSRGIHFNAHNPQQLTRSLLGALSDTFGRSTSAPVALTNPELRGSDNVAYITGFDAGNWSGQMQAYPIDEQTAEIDFKKPLWSPSAEEQLHDDYHNKTGGHNSRKVVTYDPASGKGIAFRPSDKLNPLFNLMTNDDGGDVIDYLRGDSSKEGFDDENYRERPHLLGDIVTAGPVLVRDPKKDYRDEGYAEFKEDNKDRVSTVFVGSNEGMIHAFDAETGKESWAYVPTFAYDCSLAGDACETPVGDLVPNPMRDRAMPYAWSHKFIVDGILFDNDVNFGSSASPDWRTVLTVSLGKGGHGVVALDVTKPQATSETDAAAKVLWEFPTRDRDGKPVDIDAKNVGYITDRIHIGKVDISGEQKWVAIIPSGYNNGSGNNGYNARGTGGDGKARLYIVDATTGKLIKEIIADAGSPDTPANMARIAIHTIKEDVDHSVDSAIYGGDQLGNFWRFDLTGGNPGNWKAERIAVFKDAGGQPQPVTTEPMIVMTRSSDERLAGRLWLVVGTGRYLDITDRPGMPDNTAEQNAAAAQTQTIYAFKDPLQTDVDGNFTESGRPIDNLRKELIAYKLEDNSGEIGTEREATHNANLSADPDTAIGWYIELSEYERVTVDPKVLYSNVIVAINAPSDDPCDRGGKGSVLSIPLIEYFANPSTTMFAGYNFGNTMITAMAIVQTETGEGKLLASVSNALSPEECARLAANRPGSFCSGDDNTTLVGMSLTNEIKPMPGGPAHRVYLRGLNAE